MVVLASRALGRLAGAGSDDGATSAPPVSGRPSPSTLFTSLTAITAGGEAPVDTAAPETSTASTTIGASVPTAGDPGNQTATTGGGGSATTTRPPVDDGPSTPQPRGGTGIDGGAGTTSWASRPPSPWFPPGPSPRAAYTKPWAERNRQAAISWPAGPRARGS